MRKTIFIFIIIWLILAVTIFVIFTIQCKKNADTIFKNVFEDVKVSKVVNEKLGKVDSVYVKNIYNLGKDKNGKFYTDLKVSVDGKNKYITVIIDNSTSIIGYIINGKKYTEKER